MLCVRYTWRAGFDVVKRVCKPYRLLIVWLFRGGLRLLVGFVMSVLCYMGLRFVFFVFDV